jgi:hypothetical protein
MNAIRHFDTDQLVTESGEQQMVSNLSRAAQATAGTVRRIARRLRLDEAGEGVISTAIAVLIVALLGVTMFGLFSNTLQQAGKKTDQQIQQMGGNAPAPDAN